MFPKDRKDERNKEFEFVFTTNKWKFHPTQNDILYECICKLCGKSKFVQGGNIRRGNSHISCSCRQYRNHFKKLDSKYFYNSFLHTYKCNAVARNRIFDITIHHLDHIYEQQGGLCYYSGQKLTLPINASQSYKDTSKGIRGDYNISIDRFNNNLDYLHTNIVLTTKNINFIKYTNSPKDFLVLCYKVTNPNKKGSINTQYDLSSLFNLCGKNNSKTITLDDLKSIYVRQKGLCYLTGEPLTISNTYDRQDCNCSIDRIDSNLEYTLTNTALCTKVINMMKNIFSVAEFKELCQSVYQYSGLTPKTPNFF